MTKTVLLIGIGAGDPDQLTLQAVKAMNRAGIFFLPDKGSEKAGLRAVREALCRQVMTHDRYRWVCYDVPQRDARIAEYRARVAAWHDALADRFETMIVEALPENGCGAFLVWGDPSLFDSTLRIIETVRRRGVSFAFEVIPGITSVQTLAARHKTTLGAIGEKITILPARLLARGWPDDLGSAIVMLDSGAALERLRTNTELTVLWGANLGTGDERVISGRLCEVFASIQTARRAIKEKRGWVMDVYMLRRETGPGGETARDVKDERFPPMTD
ncbi:precorrin-6A synthase (deacetylating) [Swaminathania salitolerans]|uniref:Precorrin-6A synthase [deacetylating] n=1 Tax=Swaminathania salitolerans TaxID=182838 RepID=A0A511BMA3_9PROT|nr:precorrin-6A synthase (deacetylating) [Swaminathania salitolerans]GBQ09339.1 precorrin 6A synthase [Swaminathania salitolerans LMG 21291]GEL01013.1 precorrin-6A synthase (deacetylating) [Swaminathania salitolerans]